MYPMTKHNKLYLSETDFTCSVFVRNRPRFKFENESDYHNNNNNNIITPDLLFQSRERTTRAALVCLRRHYKTSVVVTVASM